MGFPRSPLIEAGHLSLEFDRAKTVEKAAEKLTEAQRSNASADRQTVKTHRPSDKAVEGADAPLPRGGAERGKAQGKSAEERYPIQPLPEGSIKTADALLRTAQARESPTQAKGSEQPAPTKQGSAVSPKAEAGKQSGKAPGEGGLRHIYSGNSTISYFLKDRIALYIPNPVYTCLRGGMVVVDIEVDPSGVVTHAEVNESRSRTTNRCLWDEALVYAKRARFDIQAQGRSVQAGYITYRFQSN